MLPPPPPHHKQLTQLVCFERVPPWLLPPKQRNSFLDGVLSSPSGRRVWEEYLKSKLVVMEGQGKSQKLDAAPRRRPSPPGRSTSEGLLLEGEEARYLDTTDTVDETSLSSEVAAMCSDQEREGSPLSVLGEEEYGDTVSDSKHTDSGGLSFLGGATAGVEAIVAEGREKATTETDSPVSIGQLHVALEGLIKPVRQDAQGKGGGCLNAKRCASFSKKWMGGNLPTFLDPSLLQAVWSAVEQVIVISHQGGAVWWQELFTGPGRVGVEPKSGCRMRYFKYFRAHPSCCCFLGCTPDVLPPCSAFNIIDDDQKWPQGSSGRKVRVEELTAARGSVRLEAQRLFFAGFLDSSDGQNFVINALQDGTLGPAEVRKHHGTYYRNR